MLAHVADAVENAHLEVMIRTFELFFLAPFSHGLYLGAWKRLI